MKRPKGVRRGMLVVVDWLDAKTLSDGWDTHDTDTKPDPVRSAGTVVANNAQALTIAGDAAPIHRAGQHVNRPIVVPWGMVTRIYCVHMGRLQVERLA